MALHEQGQMLASFSLHIPQAHGKHLTSIIESMQQELGISLRELTAVAVSKGPGSYTGLRIGVATAKGICFALQKPLIGVNTLDAMAYQLAQLNATGAWLCPMIDARRMEVYYRLFDAHAQPQSNTQALIIHQDSFAEILSKQNIIFFGNGMPKCRSILSQHPKALFADGITPHAQYVGYLAWQSYQKQTFEDVAYFEPFYLKDFIANPSKTKLTQA